MKSVALAVRFLLELGALAAFAYWGSQSGGPTGGDVALAIAAPLAMAVVWGRFLAPKAPHRLVNPARLALEIVIFGLATAALATAGSGTLAAVFGAVAAVDTALVHIWRL
jgi:Protein of unknown function (DUF2568)